MIDQQTHKIQQRYENFDKALNRLIEGGKFLLEQSQFTDSFRDSLIQRFEFTLELSWKLQKDILESEGYKVMSPRETVSESFRFGLIEKYDIWFDMIESRNKSSHTYNEELAVDISDKVLNLYLSEFIKFREVVKQKYNL